jgi:hypothetical protein
VGQRGRSQRASGNIAPTQTAHVPVCRHDDTRLYETGAPQRQTSLVEPPGLERGGQRGRATPGLQKRASSREPKRATLSEQGTGVGVDRELQWAGRVGRELQRARGNIALDAGCSPTPYVEEVWTV